MEEPKIHESPSGRYTLEVGQKATKPGCWSYSTGIVKRDGKVIGEVNRNYHSFPFCFVEDHPNGHDYLICGEDYQGQTVIELDTGERRDVRSDGAEKGVGFCWASYEFNRELEIVIVDGCIWACPYEYRFYGFSDPMSGWPELEIDSPQGYIDAGEKAPTVANGLITCYDVRVDYDDDDEDDENDEEGEVVATQTFKREGNKLVLVQTWIDPEEEKRREEQARRRAEWEEKWKAYKATDPLFLRVKERVSSEPFNPPSYALSIGICYAGWCPHFEGKDGRVCWRLASKQKVGHHEVSLDLQWGREKAPVKLISYQDGKDKETLWFDHSLEGINAALDRAEEILTPPSSLPERVIKAVLN